MKALGVGASILAMTAGGALAGGIDRSGQGIGILFEPGRILEFSFGAVNPSVDGQEVINPLTGGPGALTGNVTGDYTQLSLGYKYDVNEKLSFALIIDQPFGADILYPDGGPLLGGTRVDAESTAATGILRYKFDGGFSVHGGVRAQRASAEIDLRGLSYGPPPAAGQPTLNSYSVALESDVAPGYLVGIAYERPDIALRVALTYNSKITHDFATTETISGFPFPLSPGETETEVSLPQSVNLDFQSGIAEDTLVFGQIRWVDWSELTLSPDGFAAATGGASLIELDDTTTFTLGVGRRFNETWSGTISVAYEDGGDPLVSPLSPTNGRTGVTLGVIYTQANMRITTGINYTWIGDAQPETGPDDIARANMEDNHSVGIGVRVAYTF